MYMYACVLLEFLSWERNKKASIGVEKDKDRGGGGGGEKLLMYLLMVLV